MKRNIYKFLSRTKQALPVLALFAVGSADAQLTYTFANTGAVQTLTLPVGNWSVQCWGANGGSITTLGGQGIGGYSEGKLVTSAAVTTLNIYVGGRGFPATGNTSSAGAGGWNGGGGGAAIGRSGAGGGGATDIRLGGITPADRIIVAGGGGGAAFYGSSLGSASVAPGGNGGGQMGENGSRISSTGVITVGGGGQGANGAVPGAANFILSNGLANGGGGGAQSFGSIGQQGTSGGPGGAQGPGGSGSTGGSAGGGGGYAGGAGGVQVGNQGVAGGGGSGYVGGVTNGTTVAFGQTGFVPNPEVLGHGYVIITELCSVRAFAASASNSVSPEICPGEFVILHTDAVGGYSWSDGQTSSTIAVAPTTNTFYTITGTGTLMNCTETGTIYITVNSGPTLNISANNTLVCLGQPVTLTASGGDSYQWSGGPASAQFTVVPSASQVFSVTGMHNANSCTTEITIPIGVVIPSVTFPGNAEVCAGNSVTLTASGADLYNWNGISTGSSGVFVFTPVGTSTVTVVATTKSLTASCPVVQALLVKMNPLPVITAVAASSAICIKETNTLAASGAESYTWTGGPASNVNIVSPTVSTIYTVTGTDDKGCVGSTMVFAFVSPCTGIESHDNVNESLNVYPNPADGMFTISSDAHTDLKLVNQLGQVLQIAQLNMENNFTHQVSGLSPGVYFVIPVNGAKGVYRKVIVQ